MNILTHNDVDRLFKLQVELEGAEEQLSLSIRRSKNYSAQRFRNRTYKESISRLKCAQQSIFTSYDIESEVYSITYHEMTYLITFRDCIFQGLKTIKPASVAKLLKMNPPIPKLVKDYPPLVWDS